jgi:hypothetical protein
VSIDFLLGIAFTLPLAIIANMLTPRVERRIAALTEAGRARTRAADTMSR